MAQTVQQHSTVRHITLSTDRPAATDPRKLFADWPLDSTRQQPFQTGTLTKKTAFSLLGECAKYQEELQRRPFTGRKVFSLKGEFVKSKPSVIVGDRVAVLGSSDEVYSRSNTGFFESVHLAYYNHFNLRTSPDDWWFCVVRRIALTIHDNSEKESVRKMFVDHDGKKKLTVAVSGWPLSEVNYPSFFDTMSEQISSHVKVPDYVDVMTAGFSTTTAVHKVVSQIALMSSMQEFFEYEALLICGIPAIEMLGTEQDWQKLLSDLNALKAVLEPIMGDLGLTEKWWSLTEKIFAKLLETYRGSPDEEWWSHIMTYNPPDCCFFKNDEEELPPTEYSGWVVEFLEGRVGLEDCQFTSGLVTVPLKIVDGEKAKDTAALVAGMAGFTVHESTENNRPSVQPFQGWALMLSPNSPLSKSADATLPEVPQSSVKSVRSFRSRLKKYLC